MTMSSQSRGRDVIQRRRLTAARRFRRSITAYRCVVPTPACPRRLSNEVKVVGLLIEPGREGVAQRVNRIGTTEPRLIPPVREAHLNLSRADPPTVSRAEQGTRDGLEKEAVGRIGRTIVCDRPLLRVDCPAGLRLSLSSCSVTPAALE